MRQGFSTPGGLSDWRKIELSDHRKIGLAKNLTGEPSDFQTYGSHPQPLLQLFIKLREISQENCIFRKFFARIYYTANPVLPYNY